MNNSNIKIYKDLGYSTPPEKNKRLKNIIDYYTNGSVRGFSKVLNGISQQKLNRLFNIDKKTKKYPSIPDNVLSEIAEKFPSVSIEWLLTGRGSMLRSVTEEDGVKLPQTLENPRARYGKPQEAVVGPCSSCQDKEKVIQTLEARLADKDKQIESLERQIESLKAGFENQINDLKNNLGMVIASKDAMLVMKEEAIKGKEATLAAKDKIINIQSKRISELESYNEAEDLKKILGSVGKIGEENTPLPNIQPETLSAKAKKGAYQP